MLSRLDYINRVRTTRKVDTKYELYTTTTPLTTSVLDFLSIMCNVLQSSTDLMKQKQNQDIEYEESSGKASSPPPEDDSDVESLHSFHYSPKAVDLPSAIRLAKRLYSLDGFKKSDVSRHLSKK